MQRKLTSIVLALCLIFSLSSVALADSADPEGYLILGSDLTAGQTQTVYDLMGITDDSIYDISYTTNQEEHEALDNYLASSVIGSKALSSILLIPGSKGSGISVDAYNISYCTVSMYQNALIDAGVADCKLYIAAPSSVSGTCALVSAMKAYSIMTGEEIDELNADAALDELVTTGEVGDILGDNDQAAELIAALKQKMLEEDMNEADINTALDQICKSMGVTIDDATRQKIIDLMMKIKNTDIDVNALKQQAGDLYNKIKGTISGLNIDSAAASSFLEKLVKAVMDFFSGFLG